MTTIYLLRTNKLHKHPVIYWWVILLNNSAEFQQIFSEPHVDASTSLARLDYIRKLKKHIEQNTASLYYIDEINDVVYFTNRNDPLLLTLQRD